METKEETIEIKKIKEEIDEKKQRTNKKIKKIKKYVIAGTIFIIVVALGIVYLSISSSKSGIVDTDYLNQLLVESSELTTAKLNITAMSRYEDDGAKIWNRSDYTMVYTATIEAGIDLEKVKVNKPNEITKTILIEIPKATIQNAKVDPASVKYFDEGFALVNMDAKEDANDGINQAEIKAKEEGAKTGILELADKQSETLIKGILANAVPDGYEIKVSFIK